MHMMWKAMPMRAAVLLSWSYLYVPIKFIILTIRGEYWFVIVNALNHLVPVECRKHEIHLKEIRKRNGHFVYMIKRHVTDTQQK